MQCGVIASADRGGSSRIMAEVVMDNMRRHQRQQQHVWSCSFAAMMMMRMTIVIMLLQLELIQVAEGLQVGYYAGTCPNVENIVKGVLSQQMQQNRGIAASVLRLHFHDCFVDGCDGSVLLEGPNSEKTASPNFSLRGFEYVDAAKAAVEAVCPGVVSCADILAFGARDAVELTGGVGWPVPSGRLDGRFSSAAAAAANIPDPSFNVQQLTENFGRKGFSREEMIILSGAHTIGVSHCASLTTRLQNPQIDGGLAAELTSACPNQGANPLTTVNLDTSTPDLFDNAYYSNLLNGEGVLESDQVLFSDQSTRPSAIFNSVAAGPWSVAFSAAMIKMSELGLKTGADGEIRQNCRLVN